MDGLITYADIFSSWVENLAVFWNILNTNVLDLINRSINSISGNAESLPAVAVFTLVKSIITILGLGNLSLLGFMFASMGTAFGIFAIIQIVKWLLDVFF